MEGYIPISYLNDFIFCPRSIYFHQLHGRRSTALYHDLPQTEGRAAHKSIDNQKYSTRRDIFESIEVYSEKYNIAGKIDTYDSRSGILTERKKRIVNIYDGYIFQLYAQYFALTESGYQVNSLRFYSIDDNKVYPIAKPEDDLEMLAKFELTVDKIKNYDLMNYYQTNINKCRNCIYESLCDQSLA